MNKKHNSGCECSVDKQALAAKYDRDSKVSLKYFVEWLKNKLNIQLN
jgi:hypothetical protein